MPGVTVRDDPLRRLGMGPRPLPHRREVCLAIDMARAAWCSTPHTQALGFAAFVGRYSWHTWVSCRGAPGDSGVFSCGGFRDTPPALLHVGGIAAPTGRDIASLACGWLVAYSAHTGRPVGAYLGTARLSVGAGYVPGCPLPPARCVRASKTRCRAWPPGCGDRGPQRTVACVSGLAASLALHSSFPALCPFRQRLRARETVACDRVARERNVLLRHPLRVERENPRAVAFCSVSTPAAWLASSCVVLRPPGAASPPPTPRRVPSCHTAPATCRESRVRGSPPVGAP